MRINKGEFMNYRSWDLKDIEELRGLLEKDIPVDEIQERLDRSKLSILNQIEKINRGTEKKISVIEEDEVPITKPKLRKAKIEKAAINFLDMKLKDKDYSSVWASILDFQEVLEDKSIEQSEAHLNIKTKNWIGIAFVGDLHIGNMACDYKTMLQHRDLIAKTPNLYVALNGDYCDNYIPSSHVSGMFEALFPPAVQKNLAKDYIESIKGKVLSLVAGCFMKGSKVSMGDGTERNIEDIKEGDYVLSGDGKPHRVSRTYANLHNGEVLKIHSEGNFEPLHVTWDHPVYVLRREKVVKKGENELRKTQFRKENLELVRANEVREGDYLCMPIPKTPKGGERENFGGYKYKITTNFLRLAGYWLAEGYYLKYKKKRTGLKFAFNSKEHHYINECSKIAEDLGLRYRIENDRKDNCSTVVIKDQDISNMFYELFGEYSHSKYIHPYILREPATKLCHMLETFSKGDGCLRQQNNRWDMTLTTISRKLANAFSFVLTKCALPHSIRQQYRENRNYNDYQINFGEESLECMKEMLLKDNNDTPQRFPGRGTRVRIFDNMMWYRITNIEKEEFQGTVYDITVSETSQLIANKRLTHNCHDLWGLKASDWDLTEYLAKHGEAVYLGSGGILYLTIGNITYKVMMRHKYKYNSSDNPTSTVKKMFEKMGGFDVGVVSHNHVAAVEECIKTGLDGSLKRLFIRAGTYKVHDRFGKQQGFEKGMTGVPVVLFNPNTRDIRGFQSIEEGISYLEYLNKDK